MKKLFLMLIMVSISLLGCERTSCWECQSNNDGYIYTTIFCDVTKKEINEVEAAGNRTYERMVVVSTRILTDTFGFYYWISETDHGLMSYNNWYGSYQNWQKYWTGEVRIDTTIIEYKAPEERFVTMECKEQPF